VLHDHPTDREYSRRENTALRAQLDPNLISVVPNAIVPETFEANPEEADPNHSKLVPHIMLRKNLAKFLAKLPRNRGCCRLLTNARQSSHRNYRLSASIPERYRSIGQCHPPRLSKVS
jgi:hypothetical protein